MSFNNVGLKVVPNSNNSESFLDSSVQTLVKPKSAKGISGFVFDIPENEDINLSSDITEHFTEDNSFINDHKINKPITVTLSGFVGELVYRGPEKTEEDIQEINNRLEVVDAYLGDFTPGFIQDAQRVVSATETAASSINQILDRTQNVVDFFQGEKPEETEQQKAFNNLFSLWRSSELVTVQTPWRYFDNMMITNIGFSQGQESDQISNVIVSLKEIRFADVETIDFDNYTNIPRVDIQKVEEEDIGKVQGREESFLFQVVGAL